MDNHANFADSTVAVAPTPPSSGTTVQVASGDGALFPAAPFNVTICPAGTRPSKLNSEIVRVTVKVGDVFTITRTQESTNARSITAGDAIFNAITVKVFTDLEAAIDVLSNQISAGTGGGTDLSPLSQAVSVISQQVSVLSQRVSVLSGQVSVNSIATTSVDSRLTSVAANIRTDSTAGSIAAISLMQAAINVVSDKVSVLSTRFTSASAQFTSIEAHVNTVSANLDAAIIAGGGGTTTTFVCALDAAVRADSTVGSIAALSLAILNDASVSAAIKTDIASVSAAIRLDEASHIASTSAVIKLDIASVSAAIMADAASHLASTSIVIKADITSVSAVIKADIASVSAAIRTDEASHIASTSAVIKTDINSVSAAIMVDVASHLTSTSAVIKADIASVSAAIRADEASHIASTSATIKTDIASVSAAIMADVASHLTSTAANIRADSTVGSMAAISLMQSAINTVSAQIANVSAVSGAGVAIGLQSVVNALSARVAAGGATTAFVCALVDTQSNALSDSMSAGAVEIANICGALSQIRQASTDVSIAAIATMFAYICAVSTKTTAGTSVRGLQSVVHALSSRISEAGGGGTGATTAFVCALVDTQSNALSDSMSAGAVEIANICGALSQIRQASTDVSIAAIATMFAYICAVSTKTTAAASVRGLQSIVHALSARISQAGGGTGATTAYVSTQTDGIRADSTVGSIAALSLAYVNDHSVSAVIKTDIASVSAAIMVDVASHLTSTAANIRLDSTVGSMAAISLMQSAINTVSALVNNVSCVSAAGTAVGLQSVINALSNKLSDSLSAGAATAAAIIAASTGGSIAALSLAYVRDAAIRTDSTVGSIAALSFAYSNDASVSAVIKLDVQSVSAACRVAWEANDVSVSAAIVLNNLSVLSAAYGGGQIRRILTGSQGMSATGFATISGLSIALVANATYHVQGRVMYTLSGVIGTAMGFLYPGSNNMQAGYMEMDTLVTVMAAGPAGSIYTSAIFPIGFISAGGMSTAATTNLSWTGVSGEGPFVVNIDGLVNTNSTGVMKLQAKQSATGTGVQFFPGSYLRAYRVGG